MFRGILSSISQQIRISTSVSWGTNVAKSLVWLFQPKCLQQPSIFLLFFQLCQRSWPLSNVQNTHRQHIKLNRFPGFNTWHLNTLFIKQFIKPLWNTKKFGGFKNVNLIINSQGYTIFTHARHWYSKPIAMKFPVVSTSPSAFMLKQNHCSFFHSWGNFTMNQITQLS